MKKLLFFFLTLCSCFALQAQNANIVVENPSGTTAVYTTFAEAVEGAEAGATVSLPTGTIPVANAYYLRKKLHFFGAGINTVVANGGAQTQIAGNKFYITEESSGSTFEGIKFTMENLYFKFEKKANAGNGFQLSFTTCELASNTSVTTDVSYQYGGIFLLNSCLVHNFYGCGSSFKDDVTANNCVFTNKSYNGHLNFNANNSIFFHTEYYCYNFSNTNTQITNCILKGQIYSCNTCSVINSIVCDHNGGAKDGDAKFINCQKQNWGDIFVNGVWNFSFGADYHLKEGSLAIGNGTNGSDMGIYGGNTPFTDGIPQNIPVVTEKLVNTRTNNNGELEGTYKVMVK